MFATIASHPIGGGAPSSAARQLPSPSLAEAYELRLLADVARWDDQAAFEHLYAEHHAAVRRVAYGIVRDAGIADDITQQTFTALWVRCERLVEKSVRLRPWLTTVARNAAIDHLRADRGAAELNPAIDALHDGPSPEAAAVAHDEQWRLSRLLPTLPAGQRAAIELVYFTGLTYAAAAQRLGEPVGTVKSRVRLALAQLRRRLTQPA